MKFKKTELTCYSNLSKTRQHPYHNNELLTTNQQINSLAFDQNQLQLEDDNRRRYRTAFSKEQLQLLEKEFSKENYVTRPKRCDLANQLKLPEATIKVWFQNRRMKDKRQKMVLPWVLPYAASEPQFAYFFAAAAAASYSQLQQSEFWQKQAKNSLINPSLMQPQSNSQQTRLPNLPGLVPPNASVPPLFITPPLLQNPLLNSSTPSIPINNIVKNEQINTVKNEQINTDKNESNTLAPETTSLNSISPYLTSPESFSYNFNNLMLRTLGLNAATSLQQQNSSVNELNHGFLSHLRELSDVQSNEQSRFNLKNGNEIKSLLDFRSSSSASNSSDCSTPSTPTPIQIQATSTTTNSNYLTNSSSSSLSGHNNSLNQVNCKSNLSLRNLNQINDCDSISSSNSPSPSTQQNELNSKVNKNELTTKIDLNAIEQFNTAILNSHHKTNDLINSNCASNLLVNKPLFQPYYI